ncbi:ATP-binding protein [Morganella morganii]|uniref:ATP-binding protein n=2 Tax=Providencia TaxID=586 RepID=A0ABT9AVP3_9GAMM|nr:MULTISPECIES: ATP-binding protein [Morganellaceae]EEO1466553.1 ATP-binding protein [Salmonella enterica subsp. enterica serovar Newport]EHZ7762867.1 ATP-binding protein [Providencia rettgeri]EIJ7166009.1 ATP-binding protein [Providencia rettgeri]ELR5092769.1 ATP-binding protein [Providencia rettgeri]MBQ0608329.1 ATP-binding protein [Providencia rettgeri]
MNRATAVYQRAILPEHCGNPLIEALPPKLCDSELAEKLSYYPSCHYEETQLDPLERVEYVSRLRELRQPLPVYLEVFRAVEMAIKEGYSAKNPLSPTTMNFLHYSGEERPDIEPVTGYFKPKGSGITVIGESGVGKTCMLEQVLGCFPDTVEHSYYENKLLPLRQVVWIKVDCPDDSSVKGLCYRILEELDRKLGIPQTKPASTIAALISQIEAKMKSSFLGILVIDEMQNLNLAKAGGADRLIGFLHNLVNNLGIPLLFCANPPFNNLLSKTLKAARRAESSGYFDVELMKNDEEWELFIEELWQLQWTNVPTPLTDELSDTLFDLSVGNMDLAVRIYQATQRALIGSDDEVLTPSALRYGASIVIRLSKPAVDKIKRDSKISVLKRRSESSEPKAPVTSANESAGKPKPQLTTSKGKLVTIPGDLTKAHHPEFSERVIELKNLDNLYEEIKDFDLFQRASDAKNPLEILKKAGVLCDDPLEIFK